jgi:hypothetical protein
VDAIVRRRRGWYCDEEERILFCYGREDAGIRR